MISDKWIVDERKLDRRTKKTIRGKMERDRKRKREKINGGLERTDKKIRERWLERAKE